MARWNFSRANFPFALLLVYYKVMQSLAKKHGTRYPWHLWFSRRKTLLVQGRDYSCRTDTMAQAIRFAAGPRRFDLGKKNVRLILNDDLTTITIEINRPLRGRTLSA
jgi:hypothetical protein